MPKVNPQATGLIVKVSDTIAIRYFVAQEQIDLKKIQKKYDKLSDDAKRLNKILNAPTE